MALILRLLLLLLLLSTLWVSNVSAFFSPSPGRTRIVTVAPAATAWMTSVVAASADDKPSSPSAQGLLSYDIPGHDNGGRLYYYGNVNAKKIVFFCGGWPDDCSVFAPMVQRLASSTTTDVLCGVTCLPGYDTSGTNELYRRDAFTSTEIVASLQEACKLLRTTVSTNVDATLTAVFHDWGCVFGAMLVLKVQKEEKVSPDYSRDSSYFSSLVYLDILPPVHPRENIARGVNLHQTLILSLYTMLFAVAHGLYRYVSYYVALPVLGVGFGILTALGLLPTCSIDADTFRTTQQPKLSYRKILYMQYPYFNLYKGLLTGDKQTRAGFYLPVSIQDTPVLYMYGLEKNLMFHNDNMLAWLRQQAAKDGSKTKVISVPDAGHWLYLQQPDVCFKAIQRFLNDV